MSPSMDVFTYFVQLYVWRLYWTGRPEFLSLTCPLTANVPKFCHVSLTRSSQHNVTNVMGPSDSLCKGKVVKMQAN